MEQARHLAMGGNRRSSFRDKQHVLSAYLGADFEGWLRGFEPSSVSFQFRNSCKLRMLPGGLLIVVTCPMPMAMELTAARLRVSDCQVFSKGPVWKFRIFFPLGFLLFF